MSEQSESLQFEKAEYTEPHAGEVRCASCNQLLGYEYFEVNGQVACQICRDKAETDLAAKTGGFRRLRRATIYGMGAGAVGAAVWYGVRALTGYEFGLIGIFMGFAIGGAVRAGSSGRGGWRYQALAMFLTYAAIVSTYIPDVYREMRKMSQAETAKSAPATAGQAAGTAPAPAQPAAGSPSPPAEQASVPNPGPAMVVVYLALLALILFAIAFVIPFLGGVSNIIGLVIIGIALYEAWKINKRAALQIAGPFKVGAAREAAAAGSSDA